MPQGTTLTTCLNLKIMYVYSKVALTTEKVKQSNGR